MLQVVKNGEASFNNNAEIAGNPIRTNLKVLYYRMFGFLYGLCGGCCDVTMANSSWTQAHIRHMWSNTHIHTYIHIHYIPSKFHRDIFYIHPCALSLSLYIYMMFVLGVVKSIECTPLVPSKTS